jgi:hypothetical protein
VIRFRATGKDTAGGMVHLMVSPIAAQVDIRVKIN